ncbi:hypothetical protein H1W37_15095 [Stappia taiwanensis]|uniref:Uncharacterized protein n=1 Tax=Stappia taiwanensis TaxID=992267 RepID=A0A838XTC2_9HYPH|nr:hypothetical protein [Stappia taiwanensis]MBA4612987.1 hypothetical protein [Stappia taiwanensis]GGF02108.1 hypothetical protein GCM10007285_32200 [Stappia taiwanensis]
MRVSALPLLSLLLTTPALADEEHCRIPEAGSWVNPAAQTRQIRRIEVTSACIDGEVMARMRAFTHCAPRDCKWGWTEASRRADGRLFARFEGFFSAREIVIVRMGERIEARVTTVPHDPREPKAFHRAIMMRD